MRFVSCIFAALIAAQAAPAQSPGDRAMQQGDFEAAFAAYTSAVAAAPDDADAQLGLGTIDMYRNDLDAARTHLERAAAIAPHDERIAARLRTLDRIVPKAGDFQISMQRPEVDVPFVATDPLPMIRATINGKEALLAIDTGATAIDLSASAAKRMGVVMHPAGEGVFAGGRKAQISAGRIDVAGFPGVAVRGVPASEIPAGMPMVLGGRHFDGFIGTTMLRQFLSTLDYRAAKLVLRERPASAQFEAAAAASGAAVVPMWLVPDHFIFARARVNDRVDGLFSVDTGGVGVGVTLGKDALAAANITPDASKVFSGVGGGGAVSVIPFTAASVSAGAFTQKNVPGLYAPAGDPYGGFPFTVTGAISQEFFRRTAVTFDFVAMKMIVEK